MTLKLQHPFTLIVAGPSSSGKSTFAITLLECREQLCDVFENIVWCHSENNAPHHLKNVTFVKGVPDFENPENVRTLIVLYDFMESAYSTKVSQLFTKGSHHRNISVVLITQSPFHQGPASRDISLNSNYIVVFKTPEIRLKLCTWPGRFTLKIFLVFIRHI
jgi:septin family protein